MDNQKFQFELGEVVAHKASERYATQKFVVIARANAESIEGKFIMYQVRNGNTFPQWMYGEELVKHESMADSIDKFKAKELDK